MHTQGWRPQQPPASHHWWSSECRGPWPTVRVADGQHAVVSCGTKKWPCGWKRGVWVLASSEQICQIDQKIQDVDVPTQVSFGGMDKTRGPRVFPKGTTGSWPCPTPPSKAPDYLWKEKKKKKNERNTEGNKLPGQKWKLPFSQDQTSQVETGSTQVTGQPWRSLGLECAGLPSLHSLEDYLPHNWTAHVL